jgi:cysteine desulfurase
VPYAYLDYNATAPLRPQARDAMLACLGEPLNPSSVHRAGRQAKKILEDSRKTIAESISAFPRELIFTASASEANNWALNAFPDRRILVGASEHSSILSFPRKRESISPPLDSRFRGNDNEIIGIDANGLLDLHHLENLLATGIPALVSVMLANNETGVIQPIADIVALCKTHGALLHVDAVQGIGKIPVEFSTLGADLMTIAAHKCGGPIGAAALVVRGDLAIPPFIRGGGQELNRRAGTENLAAIAGFAKALELAEPLTDLRHWLDAMETELAPYAVIYGQQAPRLPTTACFAMPGIGNEVQLMHFDLSGYAVSAGSACSSGRIEPSHVLLAMGATPAQASSAIRVSGGWATKEEEIQGFTREWLALYRRLSAKIS